MLTHQIGSTNVLSRSADNPRLLGADFLKAFAIFAVVFIHGSSLMPYVRSTYVDTISQFLRFCVPIFILTWAFFTEKSISKNSDTIGYLKTRFIKLLIPFIFWSTVYFFIIAKFDTLTLVKFFTMHWFGRGWSGQYYFIILFQLILLFIFVRKITLNYIKHPITVIILSTIFYIIIAYSQLFTVSLVGKIGYALFAYWIPYLILGILFARYEMYKRLIMPLPLGILILLLIPIEFYFFKPLSKPYLTPTVFISSAFFFNSIMGNNLSFLEKDKLATKVVNTLAKNTLGIFCLNPFVILIISPFIHSSGIILNYWGCTLITPILSTSLIIIICLGLIYVLKYIKLGFLVTN